MKARAILAYLLFPLTMWYSIVVGIRNLLFDIGILPQQTPAVTTIGIGNLSFGGTGKTPHVEHLIRHLSRSYTTAMLSRGYRRKSKGYQIDDGSHSSQLLGDEAAMVANKFPEATVAVCKNRLRGIERMQQDRKNIQVVVLDDVMQHRFIVPTITIMLTDFHHPFYNDLICPFGNLRESRLGKHRANIIIVTKTPEDVDPITIHNMTDAIKARTYQKVFFSYMTYSAYAPANTAARSNPSKFDNILCFTGIADAKPLIEHLKKNSTVQHIGFADHHEFSKSDIKQIATAFSKMPEGNNAIVTTDKDMARLRDNPHFALLNEIPVYSIGINVAFHKTSSQSFDDAITAIVKENVSLHSLLTNGQAKRT